MILPSGIRDRYLGVEYFGAFQFYDIPTPIDVTIIIPFYTTLLELRTKDGGLKKRWYYNQDTDNPIESISIEQTEKGYGICKVQFADLMYPVDASDVIRLYFGGEPVYEGIVDNDVDITVPIMTSSPFWKRLTEVLYTGTHGIGTSVKVVLQDVIQDTQADTGIAWNTDKVDVGISPPLLAVEYNDEVASSVIDKMVEMTGASYYWGVDSDREFFVKRFVYDADLSYRFYSSDEADFSKVTIKEDYSKIEMTEAVVYKKSETDPEAVYVGTVGDIGNVTYPPIDASNKIRRKVGKITASEFLSDTTALDWAYEVLKKQGENRETVKLTDINLEKYFPDVGDRILAEDDFKRSMFIAVDCLTDTGWDNVTEATGEGLNNTDCIKLFADDTNNSVYDFGRPVQYYKQEKIGLYVKAQIDTVIEVAFSNDSPPDASEWFMFAISDDEVFVYVDMEYKDEFQYIHFKYVAGDIYVDDIQVFCESKRQIETTIKKVSLKWDEKGIDCSIDCGDIKNPETDELNKLSRKIKILEAINSI
jgi:hypothetical protein